MKDIEHLVNDLIHYRNYCNNEFDFTEDSSIPVYYFNYVGYSTLFCIDVNNNTLYLNRHDTDNFNQKLREIIIHDYTRFNFKVSKECYKGEDSMKKQNDDASSILDDRAKLKLKIQEDVDTLSKDIAKKHSLDKTHSQVDKITKRIMKSLH